MPDKENRKAGVFIDGANLFFTQRHMGWQIDFSRLIAFFMQCFDSVEARYYVPESGALSQEQVAFNRMLEANGYTITSKPVKKIVNKETGEVVMKGNLDVELVVDALTTASRYDSFILVSGDSDFLPLIRALRSRGKDIQVYSTRGLSAWELVAEPGIGCHDFSDIRSKIELIASHEVQQSAHAESPESVSGQAGLPTKGEIFTGSIISVKSYGIFLSNPYHVKCLLPLSFLGVETRISSLPSIVRSTDLFRVAVFDVDAEDGPPRITVKLIDRQMSGVLEERAFRFLQKNSAKN